MGAGITLDVNTKSLQSNFKKIIDKGKNLQPLMFNIGEYLVAETDDRFDEERDPDGTPWKQSRRAKEEGGKTLTDTSRLRKSTTFIASNDSVLYGAQGDYVAIHHFGGTIKAKSGGSLKFSFGRGDDKGFAVVKQVVIPKRRSLGVTEENIEEIRVMTGEYLLKDNK